MSGFFLWDEGDYSRGWSLDIPEKTIRLNDLHRTVKIPQRDLLDDRSHLCLQIEAQAHHLFCRRFAEFRG